MQIIQNRRRFLAGAAGSRHCGPYGRGDTGLGRAATGDYDGASADALPLRLPGSPSNIAGELLRAEGFTDVRYVETPIEADPFALLASGELDFVRTSRRRTSSSIDAGVPITVLAGLHSGCLELIANDRIRGFTDLQGQEGGRILDDVGPARFGHPDGRLCRSRSRKRYPVGRSPGAGPMAAFQRGKDRCFPCTAARAAGVARPEGWPHDPQYDTRPAMVAAFLLHACRQRRLCREIPGGDEAGAKGHPQGCRPLRVGPVELAAQLSVEASSSPTATTTRSRACVKRVTNAGGITTPRTRCASMRCG